MRTAQQQPLQRRCAKARQVSGHLAAERRLHLLVGLHAGRADLYFFARWQPVQSVEMMVDCVNHRRADPAGGDGGAPVWRDVGADDPIVAAVCTEPGATS